MSQHEIIWKKFRKLLRVCLEARETVDFLNRKGLSEKVTIASTAAT